MESIYEGSSTHRRIQQCLVDGNGLFGSMNGNSTAFYFFYQVEAVSGTTESKLDGGILDDIELTLIDFLIPTFFPNECGSGGTTRKLQENDGRYFGLTSKPADFVLRGCKYTNFDNSRNNLLLLISLIVSLQSTVGGPLYSLASSLVGQ